LAWGGAAPRPENAWYVAAKDTVRNELIVVQGHEHPLLKSDSLVATDVHWIGPPPSAWERYDPLVCTAKIRYRQADQACTVVRTGKTSFEVRFKEPQRSPTPGQFIVLYDGDRCLGGATIHTAAASPALRAAV
jgi:tRNA-specific 2-thiouridylase